MPNPETIQRKSKKTEIPFKWQRFGRAMLDNGGDATAAYYKTFDPEKKINVEQVWVRASRLRRKLYETDWYQTLLDEAGLTRESLLKKLNDLRDAKETRFFAKDGVIISEREVPDNKTQLAASKLGLEVQGLLVSRSEVDARVGPLPESFTGWLRHEQKEIESPQPEESADDGDNPE